MSYAPSLTGGFLYEDTVIPDLADRPWAGWPHAVRDAWQTPQRSLTRLSADLTRRISATPTAAHAVSLGWHLLNAGLLWALARRVLSRMGAWMTAGLWLLLPLQTESVAYLSSRGELIAAMWLLLSLLALEQGWLAAAWVCAALAVTGKELGVMVLGIGPLWAWTRGQQWPVWTRIAWGLASLPLFGLLLRGLAVRDGLRWVSATYVAAQLTAFGRLLLLVPEALVHPSALTIDHDWIWITRTVAWTGAGLWLLLLGVVWRWPLWRFAGLAALVSVLPRLIWPIPDGLHERHLTVALVGITLVLGSLWGLTERDGHGDDSQAPA